jgi:hypothetical protein
MAAGSVLRFSAAGLRELLRDPFVSPRLFTAPASGLAGGGRLVSCCLFDTAPAEGCGEFCPIALETNRLEASRDVPGTIIHTSRPAAAAVNGTIHPITGARHHDRTAAGGAVCTMAATSA